MKRLPDMLLAAAVLALLPAGAYVAGYTVACACWPVQAKERVVIATWG